MLKVGGLAAAFLAFSFLVVTLDVDEASWRTADGVQINGVSMNGVSMNGASMNGSAMLVPGVTVEGSRLVLE